MSAKLHAFVAMPFGKKHGSDGQLIDFDDIYQRLFKPALEAAGLEVFRADQEQSAGGIRKDMFQELLIADLVLADLTLDNPNVWYELGVRHALRARGTILVQGPRETQPFDTYTDRKLRYHLTDGKLDPDHLEADKAAIRDSAKATLEAWHGKKISPVYSLVPNLCEPDWKSLQVGDAREFWEKHEAWDDRIKLAQSEGNVGDILVLADEAPTSVFRHEAAFSAAKALRRSEAYQYALEKLDVFLEHDPEHQLAKLEKGICLQRLSLIENSGVTIQKARQHYVNYLNKNDTDAEAWALKGRVDKDAWTVCWVSEPHTVDRVQKAKQSINLLKQSIDSYFNGVKHDPLKYYAAINALTLMSLYQHLSKDTRYDHDIDTLIKLIPFAINCEKDPSFWSMATLGDLAVVSGSPDDIEEHYGAAIANSDNNRFNLSSTQKQLQLLDALEFKPESVKLALGIFENALMNTPADSPAPKRVILFSGHMVDQPDRSEPRFPANKETKAKEAIDALIAKLGINENDLAICQASAGSDILFLEACQKRGARINIYLPFNEPIFIQQSIEPMDQENDWRNRFFKLKSDKSNISWRFMPESLGPLPSGVNAYERCNLWTLYTALSYGIEKVHFACLWNGEGGDGPGGTAHMFNAVQTRTGQVYWIKPQEIL